MSSNTKASSKQFALITPVKLVNKYQPLGTIQKLTYTSVLAIGLVNQNQIIPFKYPYQSPTTRIYYVPKPHSTNLFLHWTNPQEYPWPNWVSRAYFSLGWHFIQLHLEKSIIFYKDILIKHQSVVFKPILDKKRSK